MGRTLIVTATYNERDNLPRAVRQLRESLPVADVLVVDDNSPDGTGRIADELAAADPKVSVLHRPGKMGLGSAYVQAFTRGMAEGYERFFEFDADLSHDARYLPDFVRALDEGYDVVIGSRNIPGGGVVGWGPGRHLLSKGGSLYSRLILGLPVYDLTSGYKAYSRRALDAIRLGDVRSNGYSFQIETTYRAILHGMRVKEVPIQFVDRTVGRSKMSRTVFLEAVGMVWKLRADALRGKL
ncbi:MAG: polyprenol monophosphomannose synthase [Polyangiaceae bacterium]|nr:polyprenol monophosphomannose synthase [Polyangiaceae bacterium]